MMPIDTLYQNAVDREANRVLSLSVQDFLKIDDYGSIETSIDDKNISIAFWHHKLNNNQHHIVFQVDRRAILFLNKMYLSGVKLENGTITKLNNKEIGDYD